MDAPSPRAIGSWCGWMLPPLARLVPGADGCSLPSRDWFLVPGGRARGVDRGSGGVSRQHLREHAWGHGAGPRGLAHQRPGQHAAGARAPPEDFLSSDFLSSDFLSSEVLARPAGVYDFLPNSPSRGRWMNDTRGGDRSGEARSYILRAAITKVR
eukprot:1195497-Prorocentrum_minimum.AAC.3